MSRVDSIALASDHCFSRIVSESIFGVVVVVHLVLVVRKHIPSTATATATATTHRMFYENVLSIQLISCTQFKHENKIAEKNYSFISIWRREFA